jgi:uncharacterized membrane protein YczE
VPNLLIDLCVNEVQGYEAVVRSICGFTRSLQQLLRRCVKTAFKSQVQFPRIAVRVARWVALFLACAVWGFGVVLTLRSQLGVAPWEVLHVALSARSGISIGRVGQIVSLIIVVLAYLVADIKPGWATVVLGFLVGFFIDYWYRYVPESTLLGIRIAMLLGGIVIIGFATGLYLHLGFGAGPRDSAMLAVGELTGRSLRASRTLLEVTVLATGTVLGGPLGIGTLIYALTVGPAVQFFLWLLGMPSRTIRGEDSG